VNSSTQRAAGPTLALLAAINFMNFYDRQVVGAVGERIKVEWQLSDSQLAGLGTAFVLLYAIVGIPLGRLADVGKRSYILAVGIIAWSVFTGLSGLASSFAMLVLCRLAVGVGEASAAPAANSMIGDLFPGAKRGRAISIFMLGLPFGLGASYVISGLVTEATGGWRPALFVAAAPGFVLGLLALFIPEPARGAADPEVRAANRTSMASIRNVLSMPTMWWIIASGAVFNLNMYALSAFNTSFLIRFHGLNIDISNRFSGAIFGLGGAIGMLAGGWIGDRAARGGPAGRMRVAALGSLITVPLTWAALEQPAGSYWPYALLMIVACGVMYVYYTNVMATIYDLVEPRERGTAMAVYFFVFYIFIAIGLIAFGKLSDGLASQAVAAGATAAAARAAGLHGAMYAVPIGSVVLALVLWAGARTAPADHARLRG
jgi:MFS family permease